MTETDDVDYGPLTGLIGSWTGAEGVDIAPEPDGEENNPYFETITFEPIGDVSNAETQRLVGLRYHQSVTRKSTGKVFHDETGYWLWDAENETLMHSLTIPRAVCVLAGGHYTGEKDADGRLIFHVEARIDDEKWSIIQSPFMQENARTTEFRHKVIVGNGTLYYRETTTVEIYGKTFEHTDENTLVPA